MPWNSIPRVAKNVAVGTHAMNNNVSGSNNVAVGFYASEKNTTGAMNVAVGSEALRNNLTGSANDCRLSGCQQHYQHRQHGPGLSGALQHYVGRIQRCAGSEAGYDETGSNKLYIDNQQRGSEAAGR